MDLGPIKGLVLLGGGEIMLDLALWAKGKSIEVKIITSSRHSIEITIHGEVKQFLELNRLPHLVVDDIDAPAVEDFLANSDGFLYLSFGAAWIFKNNTIEHLFKNRLLNVHGTGLPTNRGGGGFSWQILMGNRFGYSLIHKVDAGVDTGPIIAFEEYLYPHHCRIPRDFEEVYKSRTSSFLKSFISKAMINEVTFEEVIQVEYLSTYWPRLNTELNGWINWNSSAADIEKFICAFDDPYAGAQTFLDHGHVRLKNVCLSPQDASFHSYQSGLVYRVAKEWICVAVPGNTLVVSDVFDQNGNSIFEKIKPGDRFHTPHRNLEDSLTRPIYTSRGLKLPS